MKWIEINKQDDRIILNVDKIIKIKTFEYKEQFGINIYYQSGQNKECISLNYLDKSLRESEYDRILDFLLCSDTEVTRLWIINK